ncbi:NUDIX hydrolase [Pseudonocardia sp. KRD-184]|uniref:NUDIX hydrolase n=1 Tax=Pseudonocardia oceani TaxID=2792013 RepID=A0ABS6U2Z5_9PSEU|nr:NUDIX hydrolase [Pseudonocardia oceani]MBW0088703.1 NUDIX hydrolase [Pseudonocardia oceani]MBW0095642.1 NUDIX hydrolase [Pseudonocardia oceani]MBW0121827.1 NUDIX hydrolase [Pseudonocardia oceani]MBW0126617.1 NUDIX hydrolase [Pseudonocardia oceani]
MSRLRGHLGAAADRLVDAQERRWLAALLAALSHHVEVSTLDDPSARNWLSSERDLAVAVVTGPDGVLVGRHPDRIPPWVLPGGWIEGDTPGEAAVRNAPRRPACTSQRSR